MADLQPYFEKFHKKIRLDQYDQNEDLRSKRDMLIDELRERLPADVPAFDPINQGSYAYNMGTMPKDGNYDIDVGLIFDCQKDAYQNPVDLKKHVRDAITHGNRSVRIRAPCVTVEYMADGKVAYHVDLTVYVNRADSQGYDLAIGLEGAAPDKRSWDQSDPIGFVEAVRNRWSGDDGAQMRRSVRYLKRWRDHCFGAGAPISCSLTIAAYHWFAPDKDFWKTYRDVEALRQLVGAMLANFNEVQSDAGLWVRRLQINAPALPYDDLLGNLSDAHMAAFETKLKTLKEKLEEAATEDDDGRACKLLVTQFGDEFPGPDSSGGAKQVVPPYIPTGQSA